MSAPSARVLADLSGRLSISHTPTGNALNGGRGPRLQPEPEGPAEILALLFTCHVTLGSKPNFWCLGGRISEWGHGQLITEFISEELEQRPSQAPTTGILPETMGTPWPCRGRHPACAPAGYLDSLALPRLLAPICIFPRAPVCTLQSERSGGALQPETEVLHSCGLASGRTFGHHLHPLLHSSWVESGRRPRAHLLSPQPWLQLSAPGLHTC